MSKKAINYSDLMISLLGQVSRKNGQLLGNRLESEGVSLQEFRIIGLLIGETGCNQKELAKKLSVQPATLSVAINKLEKRGLIERKTSPTDKRVNYLTLSDEIDFTKMDEVIVDVEERMTAGIKAKDLETAKKVIRKMVQNLNSEIS